MATIAPPQLVTGAPRLPLPYGLFSIVVPRTDAAERWENGVVFESLTCEPAGGIGEPVCYDPGTPGQDAVQSVELEGEVESFTLAFADDETDPIAPDATGADVQSALEALESIGAGNVAVTGEAGGPYVITFTGYLADAPQPTLVGAAAGEGAGVVVQVVQDGAEPIPGEQTVGLPKNLERNGVEPGVASDFTIYGHYQCSPIGNSLEYAEERAEQHLIAREQARVEQAIWTGDLGNTPTLRGATVLGSGAVSIRAGIAALEAAIATEYGSLGVIHMTRETALLAIAASVLRRDGGRLFTELGTPVVAGAGYDGSGPDGTPASPGESWAYVTPAIFGYRGEVFTSSGRPGDLLDRSTNDLYAVAERTYVIGWEECGVSAVLLTIGDGDPAPTP